MACVSGNKKNLLNSSTCKDLRILGISVVARIVRPILYVTEAQNRVMTPFLGREPNDKQTKGKGFALVARLGLFFLLVSATKAVLFRVIGHQTDENPSHRDCEMPFWIVRHIQVHHDFAPQVDRERRQSSLAEEAQNKTCRESVLAPIAWTERTSHSSLLMGFPSFELIELTSEPGGVLESMS